MASQQVSITIRASDGTGDYSLSCNVEWSITQLKEIIRATHPSKPEVFTQTLFYGEKELQSNQVINSFLKTSDNVHLIKLVLTPKATSSTHCESSRVTEGTELRHRNVGGNTPLPPHDPWLQWQQASYYQQYSYPQQTASNEHYAAMWQQYQQQVNDYMNYYNSLGQSQPGATVQPSSPVTQTDGANPPPAAPADAPPPQANVPEANPPMNAQGGFVAADNDDLVANDWLDVLFTMFRYVFFLSIIYFYSNFWRFLLVAGFFFIMYIYQSGVFRAQRRAPHPQEVERRVDRREGEQENTDDNNNDNNSNNENAENETEEQEVPPPSIFATAWCFITTFFSSLIPQPPPVV